MKESYTFVEKMNDVYYKVYYTKSEEGKKEIKASYTYHVLITKSVNSSILENRKVVEITKEVNLYSGDTETTKEENILTLKEYIKVLQEIEKFEGVK